MATGRFLMKVEDWSPSTFMGMVSGLSRTVGDCSVKRTQIVGVARSERAMMLRCPPDGLLGPSPPQVGTSAHKHASSAPAFNAREMAGTLDIALLHDARGEQLRATRARAQLPIRIVAPTPQRAVRGERAGMG